MFFFCVCLCVLLTLGEIRVASCLLFIPTAIYLRSTVVNSNNKRSLHTIPIADACSCCIEFKQHCNLRIVFHSPLCIYNFLEMYFLVIYKKDHPERVELLLAVRSLRASSTSPQRNCLSGLPLGILARLAHQRYVYNNFSNS